MIQFDIFFITIVSDSRQKKRSMCTSFSPHLHFIVLANTTPLFGFIETIHTQPAGCYINIYANQFNSLASKLAATL